MQEVVECDDLLQYFFSLGTAVTVAENLLHIPCHARPVVVSVHGFIHAILSRMTS